MKEKILSIMIGLIAAGVWQSCTNEVDDLFDSSAQQRVNQEIKDCKALLVSSDLGWRLDYYPNSNQKYGGYAMTLKFDDTHVTAASEITGDPGMTFTSLYSVKSDMGVTLNFDSYNDVLHFFADPDNSGGAGTGKGYEGDYEFVIQSRSQDEIILKGKKTKNLMKMVRLTEPSKDYLTAIMQTEAKVSSVVGVLGYKGSLNGQEVAITLPSDRRMSIQINDESLVTTGFMYTTEGIRLYQPVMIGNKEIDTLKWSDEKNTFVSEDGSEFTIIPDPVYPKYCRFLGEYTMNYSYGSAVRAVNIRLNMLTYSPSTKAYVVEGLPFPLQIQYNTEKDCMEILTYTTSSYYVAVWEVIGNGSLSWGAGFGLIGQLKEGSDNVYEFVDNGVWGSNVARALILWSASGEYRAFGGDSRFQYITFTKK